MKVIALPASPRVGSPLATAVHRLGRCLSTSPLALWRAACRQAERPQRVVPYY